MNIYRVIVLKDSYQYYFIIIFYIVYIHVMNILRLKCII